MSEFRFPKYVLPAPCPRSRAIPGVINTNRKSRTNLATRESSHRQEPSPRTRRDSQRTQEIACRLKENRRLCEALSQKYSEIFAVSFRNPAIFSNPVPFPSGDPNLELLPKIGPGGSLGTFSFQSFHNNFIANMASVYPTAPYAFVVMNEGKFVSGDSFGQARGMSDAPELLMTIDQPVNIASVSKVITAAAVLKIIESNPLLFPKLWDEPIWPFFPEHWGAPNDEFAWITIKNCLQYRIGVALPDGEGTKVAQIRSWFKDGKNGTTELDHTVFGVDTKELYNNVCYAWFRIALFYMTASPATRNSMLEALKFAKTVGFTAEDEQDYIANAFASYYYADWVRDNILLPIGCSKGVYMNPVNRYIPGGDNGESKQTLYYHYPGTGSSGLKGENWSLKGGGGGWFLSATDLARFWGHLKTGKLLSKVSTDLIFNYDTPYDSFSLAADPVTRMEWLS